MNCPDCAADLHPNARRCSCGWRLGQGGTYDPDRYRCVNVDRGLRCGQLGTISPNTHGSSDGKSPHPGPWYCAAHMPGLHARTAGPMPDGTIETLRALTKRVAPVPKPLSVEELVERAGIQGE